MIDNEFESILSLDDQFLIFHPATFIIEVSGHSSKLGLKSGDKLIINRALLPAEDQLVLIVKQNEFHIQRYLTQQSINLVNETEDFVWGVVIAVLREPRR